MKHIFTACFLIFVVIFANAQLPGYVPTQNLIAWYSFNGNSADSSGNGNHLTNSGATLTTDRNNNANSAYSFDGVNDYLGIASPAFQMGDTSSFSVSFWVNKSNTSFGMPYWHGLTIGQGGSGKFVHFMQMNTSNATHWGTNKQGSAWVWAQSTYTVNTWEHWAGVYDNNVMKLYKNGVQVATNTYSYTGTITSTMPFYIGSNLANANNYFNGKVDDFGIWHRALTPAEINNLFNPCTTVIGGIDTVIACDSYHSQSGVTYTTTGNYSDTLQTALGCDSIITLNLTINSSSTGTETVTRCFEYTSPSGTQTWTASGIYSDTLMNAVSCDSIITVNLTINTVDKSVITSALTLTANAANATFQWLDCNNNYSVINGATNSLFQPSVDGNYAVEVTQNTCKDTSSCYAIIGVGIDEIISDSRFEIYPNPTNGVISISTNIIDDDISVEVLDLTGKIIYSKDMINRNSQEYLITISDLKNGVYIVRIICNNKNYSKKLIILK